MLLIDVDLIGGSTGHICGSFNEGGRFTDRGGTDGVGDCDSN